MTTDDELWQQRFAELENYIRIFGHARIPRSSVMHQKLREWLRCQQRMAASGALSTERWWRFQQIGVALLGNDERWHLRFAQVREFRERHGHCRVPAKWKEDKPLGHWVHVQREFKKRGTLSAERIAMLESIGFEWKSRWVSSGSSEAHWEEMLGLLREFAKVHGHADVLKGDSADRKLYNWVMDQREVQNAGTLRPDRRERLDALGFVWRSTLGITNRWDLRFRELLEFRERFGHCHVPAKWKENIQLGHWTHVQREYKKKGKLSPDRIARLEAIGFAWHSPRSSSLPQKEQWDRMFAHLVAFQKEHGHTRVPHGAGPDRLGQWATHRRSEARHGTLPESHRAALESIGFAWEKSPEPALAWERHFGKLAAFQQQHGHCRVPGAWPEHPYLASWIYEQRKLRKRGKLPPEQIRRLDGLGFVWESRPHSAPGWEGHFAKLAAFQQQHGHCRVPGAWPEHPYLAFWIYGQRKLRKCGKLPPERIRRLDGLGFDWENGRLLAAAWDERFQQLLAFRERHGHCRVPRKENILLSNWVHNQRNSIRAGNLSDERIRRLEAIGFTVPPSGSRASRWEQHYGDLLAFRQQHGHCRVPMGKPENSVLAHWVSLQRANEKRGVLDSERKRRLDSIGFEWSRR